MPTAFQVMKPGEWLKSTKYALGIQRYIIERREKCVFIKKKKVPHTNKATQTKRVCVCWCITPGPGCDVAVGSGPCENTLSRRPVEPLKAVAWRPCCHGT